MRRHTAGVSDLRKAIAWRLERSFTTLLPQGNHVDLAIVIPVLNEAESLARLLDEVAIVLDGPMEYEILVVGRCY